MSASTLDLAHRGFSIVPGPRAGVSGMSSVGLREIEEIEPGHIAVTLPGPSGGGRLLWGGFELEGVATPRDLATIAQHLKRAHRGVWIHGGESRLSDPDDFEASVRG